MAGKGDGLQYSKGHLFKAQVTPKRRKKHFLNWHSYQHFCCCCDHQYLHQTLLKPVKCHHDGKFVWGWGKVTWKSHWLKHQWCGLFCVFFAPFPLYMFMKRHQHPGLRLQRVLNDCSQELCPFGERQLHRGGSNPDFRWCLVNNGERCWCLVNDSCTVEVSGDHCKQTNKQKPTNKQTTTPRREHSRSQVIDDHDSWPKSLILDLDPGPTEGTLKHMEGVRHDKIGQMVHIDNHEKYKEDPVLQVRLNP